MIGEVYGDFVFLRKEEICQLDCLKLWYETNVKEPLNGQFDMKGCSNSNFLPHKSKSYITKEENIHDFENTGRISWYRLTQTPSILHWPQLAQCDDEASWGQWRMEGMDTQKPVFL